MVMTNMIKHEEDCPYLNGGLCSCLGSQGEALPTPSMTSISKDNSKEQLAILNLLQRLYNKSRIVRDKDTGVEFAAVHHKDIDYEYWKIKGETLQ